MSTPPFLDLPAGVRPERLTTRRGTLAALVADASAEPVGSAVPVLLVPGYTGSKEDFIAVLEPIAAAGHPVTAIDLRGQFESPGDDEPTAYDLAALADDVLALAGVIGRPLHLVGHSLGGLVARAAALADPVAFATLTLLDSGPAAIPHPAASNLGLLVQALPTMDLESIWVAKRRIESATEATPPPPHIEDFLHRRFVANHPLALLRLAEQLLAETDRVAELARVDVPLLVAYGADDDGWPPTVQAEMAARLGATVAEIPHAAHSPAAENPAATAHVLTTFWKAAQ
ncbi:MAG: alpha/beta fold hydrolase [Actinomycetes bacterium]